MRQPLLSGIDVALNTVDAELQLNSLLAELERRRDKLRQTTDNRFEELRWLDAVLTKCQEPTLKQLTRQTRFLIERALPSEKRAAFQTLTKDYCIQCGKYLGNGDQCEC